MDSNSTDFQNNHRREERHPPYRYLPRAIVNPDAPEDERYEGFIRNQSRHGFSGQFDQSFPYVVGDIVDVQVSYERAWAKVVWVENVYDRVIIVGFRLHPESFLKNHLKSSNTE